MIESKIFKLPIYNLNYEVVFFSTLQEAKTVYPDFRDNGDAMTVVIENNNIYLMMFKDTVNEGILVHECVHFANYICLNIGYTPALDNDEPLAYLIEHLFNTVYEFYKSIQISVYRKE